MLGDPREVDLDESKAAVLKRIGRRVDTLNLFSRGGEDCDEDALADALERVRGIERIEALYVDPSSRVKDLRFIRALPGLKALFVRGLRVASLAGMEWFRSGHFLEVATGKNRRRDISALAEAPLTRFMLFFANPADIEAVARSRTLLHLEISGPPNLNLAQWGDVPLECLSLWGGALAALADTEQIASLRQVTLNGCGKLERFEGRSGNVNWMIVQDCPRLDWRTLKVFEGLQYIAVKSRVPVPLTILSGLRELREASLLRCQGSGVKDLRRLAPKLDKIYLGGLKDSAIMALSKSSPGVTITNGRLTFLDGVAVKDRP